jgi:hypothetical protein
MMAVVAVTDVSEGGPMVRFLVATPLVIFMVLLAVGALTGRVRARSCCSLPEASQDRRLQADRAGTDDFA